MLLFKTKQKKIVCRCVCSDYHYCVPMESDKKKHLLKATAIHSTHRTRKMQSGRKINERQRGTEKENKKKINKNEWARSDDELFHSAGVSKTNTQRKKEIEKKWKRGLSS